VRGSGPSWLDEAMQVTDDVTKALTQTLDGTILNHERDEIHERETTRWCVQRDRGSIRPKSPPAKLCLPSILPWSPWHGTIQSGPNWSTYGPSPV
jgi:hypothetical protein